MSDMRNLLNATLLHGLFVFICALIAMPVQFFKHHSKLHCYISFCWTFICISIGMNTAHTDAMFFCVDAHARVGIRWPRLYNTTQPTDLYPRPCPFNRSETGVAVGCTLVQRRVLIRRDRTRSAKRQPDAGGRRKGWIYRNNVTAGVDAGLR